MPSKKTSEHPLHDFPLHVLREYALLADGERGIIVGPRGEFVWMCMPRWHSDAIFSTLIGGRGVYAVTPHQRPFVWGGYYEPGSLIWHSRWVTTKHILESREALAFPGDVHTAVILRRPYGVESDATVDVVLDPREHFGRRKLRNLERVDGSWVARCGDLYIRWSGAEEARQARDGSLEAIISIPRHEYRDLILEISDHDFDGPPPQADRLWTAAEESWKQVAPQIHGTLADSDAIHSAVVIRGLTSAEGGMVAGVTMSLPERAEQHRNYDYRYAWIRDQCYAGQAAAATGVTDLLDNAVKFVSTRLSEDREHMKPAYTVDGGRVPDERSLNLAGYPGGTDKVGNWVNEQFQLDAFGETLLLFAAAGRMGRLDAEHWKGVEAAVEAIRERWQEPDAGIWELEPRRWAHSQLTCVAGIRSIASLAPPHEGSEWSGLADTIAAEVDRMCLHPSGRWQRSPHDARVDSALLIPPIRGAFDARDPRTLATLEAVLEELSDDFFMYRYRFDHQPLGNVEGAFLLCGFITALALHQQGRDVEADRWFERNRAACGPPGIYTEEFDISQRQLRGNMPQAFVHALMLETAQRLAEPWPTR